MDAETRTLFESQLLSLAKTRAREGRLPDASNSGSVKNPFCGDEIAVDLRMNENGALEALGYEAKACSLCVASAELLNSWLDAASPPLADADAALRALAQAIDGTLKGEMSPPEGFESLASVMPFRARHKCVTLPIDAALKALEKPKT